MPQNKEYIEKDSIIKFITERLSSPDESKQFGHDAVEILTEIEFMESADVVEVKHGRWEERPVNVGTPTTDLFCSECNFASFHWRYNYCPDCGAKMDKEK